MKKEEDSSLIFFLTSCIVFDVEVPQLIEVPVFVRRNHAEPITDVVLLQILLRQILQVPNFKIQHKLIFKQRNDCLARKLGFMVVIKLTVFGYISTQQQIRVVMYRLEKVESAVTVIFPLAVVMETASPRAPGLPPTLIRSWRNFSSVAISMILSSTGLEQSSTNDTPFFFALDFTAAPRAISLSTQILTLQLNR